MKKAVIFYQSKTGTTQNYAQEISSFLQTKKVVTQCLPVNEYHENVLQDIDYVLMGCWTKGLMVIFQKPDKTWSDFAKKVSIPKDVKVALFATFKIRTGSMFKNMAKHIQTTVTFPFPTLKSKDGNLTNNDRVVLEDFIAK